MTLKVVPNKNGYDVKEVDAIPVEVIDNLIEQGYDVINSETDINFKNSVRKKVDFLIALKKTWKAKQQ